METLCGLTSPMSESVWGIGGHRRGKDCRVGCKRPCVDSSAPYQAWLSLGYHFPSWKPCCLEYEIMSSFCSTLQNCHENKNSFTHKMKGLDFRDDGGVSL